MKETKNINAMVGSITQAITEMGSAAGNWSTLIQKDAIQTSFLHKSKSKIYSTLMALSVLVDFMIVFCPGSLCKSV